MVCLFVVSASAQKAPVAKKFTTSGYFDDIDMTSKESGDYCCLSVYLTESDGQMYALITRAEGTIFDPVLVEAKVTGKDMRGIEFTLPGDNGDRKFKGTVSASAFTLYENGTKSVLKRECASTFSNITVGSGGDYGGTEVYVTDSAGSWFVLVTIAEGVLKAPKLVPAKVTGKNYDKIAFTLPGDNGDLKFTGTRGKTMTLTQSGTSSVLKSKCYQ